jgi:hypothetical protein
MELRMFSRPATTLAARVVFVFAMSALTCNAFAVDSRETPTQRLQELGVQIKLASNNTDIGRPPTMTDVANFEQTLSALGEAAPAVPGSPFQRKLQAVSLLFAKLKYQTTHPQPAPARTGMSRAQVDIEVVSGKHGGTCESALGISESLPVKTKLAQTGNAGSQAWFHFEVPATGHFRFKTDSMGADPAIEVSHGGCSAGMVAMAANDDNLGLDAAVSVAATQHAALIVHLINLGEAGAVELGVQSVNGTISGKITDAATALPLNGAQVEVYNIYGGYMGADNADQGGNYSLSVSPGTYYVRAAQNLYVAELYPNAECSYNSYYYNLSSCPIAQAQTISVDDAATVSNINLALSTGRRISGVVHDSQNQTVSSASIYLYDGTGVQLGGTSADNFGRYSFTTVPSGTYKLAAQANGYGSQMWNAVACGGPLQTQCDLSQASSLNVSAQDVGGVGFNLPLLATIQGNLSGPGLLPLSYNNNVYVLDTLGNLAAQTYADSSGHYRAGPLPLGNYYAYAIVAGYFPQIFDAIDCPLDCYSSISAATAIAITQVGQVGVADFQLTPLPAVHGHVQDAVSGLPLANVTIATSVNPPAAFNTVSSATTNSNGDYTLNNTPAGKYYLWAQSNDHIDQVYPGIACEGLPNYYQQYAPCDVTGATLLTISPGQTPPNFDFVLQASSGISGNAKIRAGPGSDLPASVQINVYNGAGIVVGTANTDSLGNYLVTDLPAGTYFVSAGAYYYNQYVTQVWQQIDCPNNCAATAGTAVVVGQNTVVPGIDFDLARRDAIVGRVTNNLAAPVGGVLIDLFDAVSHNYVATAATDAQGFYAASGNIGYAYYVATEVGSGYVDQVYSGIVCPLGPAYFGLCPFTSATAVGLPYGNSQPHIVNFVLQSNDPIFRSDFE